MQTRPLNTTILKHIIYKQITGNNNFSFIPYDVDYVISSNTMKSIIVHQNTFLDKMTIVSITHIATKDRDAITDIFSKSKFFAETEATRNQPKAVGSSSLLSHKNTTHKENKIHFSQIFTTYNKNKTMKKQPINNISFHC